MSTVSTSSAARVREPIEHNGPAAYVAEFVGTAILVAAIGFVISNGAVAAPDFAALSLLHVFLLMMLIATLGGTSGAHFNPAVTVTLAALRKIAWVEAGIYIALQLAGAVAGALLVKLLLDDEGSKVSYGGVGAGDPIDGSAGLAFLAEAVGTFMLMWAIMGMAVNPRGDRNFAPLVIGATLGFAVLMIGPLTGAGLNPARAFGPNVVGGTLGSLGDFVLAFVLGPLVGALAAGFGYTALVLRREPDPDSGVRPIDKLD